MAPARAFENLWPQKITFALGAAMTGVISLAMQPWYVLSTFSAYIFVWLGTYGAMLGAFDGIAIADYWLVRNARLDLAELYKPDGMYSYAGGFNVRAVVALLAGWALALLGLAIPPLHFLWDGGWIFSLLGGMAAYWALMRGAQERPLTTEATNNATA
jgi:NCS1 family nucleobase:cation symporter-1